MNRKIKRLVGPTMTLSPSGRLGQSQSIARVFGENRTVAELIKAMRQRPIGTRRSRHTGLRGKLDEALGDAAEIKS